MNIFSNINLKKNTVNNAVIGDWTESNDNVSGGAIKYNDGSLFYYNGNNWTQVGTSQGLSSFSLRRGNGDGHTGSLVTIDSTHTSLYVGTLTNNNINYLTFGNSQPNTGSGIVKIKLPDPTIPLPGPVSVYTSDNFPDNPAQNNVVPITLSSTTTPNNDSSIKVKGNGKGSVSFESSYAFSDTAVTTTVSTPVVTILYCNITINASDATNISNGTYLLKIKHGRNTPNVLVNTWYSEKVDDTHYKPYNLIQCDVSILPEDNRYDSIYIYPSGAISQGVIKVVLYCGEDSPILNTANDEVILDTNASSIDSSLSTTTNITDGIIPTAKNIT